MNIDVNVPTHALSRWTRDGTGIVDNEDIRHPIESLSEDYHKTI